MQLAASPVCETTRPHDMANCSIVPYAWDVATEKGDGSVSMGQNGLQKWGIQS